MIFCPVFIIIATVRSIIEYGSQFLGEGTKEARVIINSIHKEAICVIAGIPEGTAVDALEHKLNLPHFEVQSNIATAKFITKVAKNSNHLLHANLGVWYVQDPDLFLNKCWGIKASHTMLRLFQIGSFPHLIWNLSVFHHGFHTPLTF